MQIYEKSVLMEKGEYIARCWEKLGFPEDLNGTIEHLKSEFDEFLQAREQNDRPNMAAELADVAILVTRVLALMNFNPDHVFRVRGDMIEKRHHAALQIFDRKKQHVGMTSYREAKKLLAEAEKKTIETALKYEQ